MSLNRHSLDMSPCFEDRMSLADIEFPTLAEHYYLDAENAFNDTTDLFRWDSPEDQFAFDMSINPSLNNTGAAANTKAAFFPNQLAERHLSCGSLFSVCELPSAAPLA